MRRGMIPAAIISALPGILYGMGNLSFSKDTVFSDGQWSCGPISDSVILTNSGPDTVQVDSLCCQLDLNLPNPCVPHSPVFAVGFTSVHDGAQTLERIGYYETDTGGCCEPLGQRYDTSPITLEPGGSVALKCFLLQPCFSCPVATGEMAQANALDSVGVRMIFKSRTGDADTLTLVGYLELLCSLGTRPRTARQSQRQPAATGRLFTIRGEMVEPARAGQEPSRPQVLVTREGTTGVYGR